MGRNRLCAWREGACGDVCARVHAFFFFFFSFAVGTVEFGAFPHKKQLLSS